MNRIKTFINKNIVPLISLFILFIVLIIILIAFISKKNNIKLTNNVTSNENTVEDIDYTDLEHNATNGTYLKSDNVDCSEMSLAVNSYSDFFVTNDGRLFKYDLNRLFDNDKNCKEITWSLYEGVDKAVSIFSMTKNNSNYTYVLGNMAYDSSSSQKSLYHSYLLNNLKEYELTDKDYSLGYAFDISVFKDTTIYQLTNSKAIILDGILYNVKLKVENLNVTPKLIYNYEIGDIAFQPKDDETIVKILDTVIITDKRIYTYELVDDNCMNYVDQECVFGYKENIDLSRIINEILFVDEYHVILNDGTSYVINAYGLE